MRVNDPRLDDSHGRLSDPSTPAGVSMSADWVYTVIYDGQCAVCNRLVSLWIRWDRHGRLEVLPSQTPGVPDRFPQIPLEAYEESLQVVDRDGRVWTAADAFAKVFEVLPWGTPIAGILDLKPLRPLTARLYGCFARNRYRFGCSVHCATRSRAARKRRSRDAKSTRRK